MKQQILVIHGGTTFDTYEEYISYLKSKEMTIDRLKYRQDWKDGLGEELGENYEVLSPRMPNGTNARYEEWEIWLERMIPVLDNNLILIGHSLGGIFLAKYLAENVFAKKIKATILVAPPFDAANGETLSDFKLPAALTKLAEQGGQIYLVQSKDDPVVPFTEQGKYQKALPNAKTLILETSGHFKQESFPELVGLIKKL